MPSDEPAEARPAAPPAWVARPPAPTGAERWRRTRAGRRVTLLGMLGWAPVAVLAVTVFAVGHASSAGEIVLIGCSVALFAVLLTRLGTAARIWDEERQPLLTLAAAIAMYAVGALALNLAPQTDVFAFPGPGTPFFLGASALMAGYLALMTLAHTRVSPAIVLEAVITCGGAACLVSAVLLLPASTQLDQSGVPLLGALIYPVLDLVMVLIVLGGAMLQRRLRTRRTGKTLAGFLLLTVADFPMLATVDSSLLDRIDAAGIDLAGVLYVVWGAAFVLIVAGACTPYPDRAPARRGFGDMVPPVSAALLAIAVLALRAEHGQLYVTVPAVVTLLASAARLALALQEARTAAEAYRQSLTDELTGLPNRRAVVLRLEEMTGEGRHTGLLVIDLDRFSVVNDALGSVAGDDLLRAVAERLRAWLPDSSLVARIGGDEFAVVTTTANDTLLTALAGQLQDLVHETGDVGSLQPTASVGISAAAPGDAAGDVLRQAYVAVRQAQGSRTGVVRYDPEKDGMTSDQLVLADRLRAGIPAGQLRMWYQPQVFSEGLGVHGLEALVRWHHPDLGLVPPGDFLGVARSAGLMPRLTEAVVDLVLADVTAWSQRGLRVRVSFNLAPPELLNPGLVKHLLEAIAASGVPRGSLVVELTEDSFLVDPEQARRALTAFDEHAVQVAIDDYGTGFSSLQYLRDLPVHELKMDRSFVHAVGVDPRSRIIVESTNQMAHGLGMRTVAEGVEDEAAAQQLAGLGVDILQGYHFARPMPAKDVVGWLRDWELQHRARAVPSPRPAPRPAGA